MNVIGWWRRKKTDKIVKLQSNTMDKDICPECNGQGYSLNDIHYLSDADDYERRYLSCRRCNGTGRYYKNRDDY